MEGLPLDGCVPDHLVLVRADPADLQVHGCRGPAGQPLQEVVLLGQVQVPQDGWLDRAHLLVSRMLVPSLYFDGVLLLETISSVDSFAFLFSICIIFPRL